MSLTTKTTFENTNSQPIECEYVMDGKFVILRRKEDGGFSDEIYLDFDQIKRINRVINKNLKELKSK